MVIHSVNNISLLIMREAKPFSMVHCRMLPALYAVVVIKSVFIDILDSGFDRVGDLIHIKGVVAGGVRKGFALINRISAGAEKGLDPWSPDHGSRVVVTIGAGPERFVLDCSAYRQG